MTDPRIVSIATTIFALLGTYNLYTGSRRMRDARLAGRPIRWFRQINLLTGIEYILLTFVFLLIMASQQGSLAPGMRGMVKPLYFILLIVAAILAGFAIRQSVLNARITRTSKGRTTNVIQAPVAVASTRTLSKREQEEQAQRRRERRHKAAEARRRRAGRA